jgi:hypothetical protein
MEYKYYKNIIITIIIIVICLIVLSQINLNKSNECKIHISNNTILPKINNFDISSYKKDFLQNEIVYIENFFDNNYFEILKESVNSEISYNKSKRTGEMLQNFRQAGSLNSNVIQNSNIINLYYSKELINIIQQITNNYNIQNVTCNDKSSYNILIYDKPNDYINWHLDPNQYTGNRLTILISIYNENDSKNNLSSSELQYKLRNLDKIQTLKMKPNSILIFNGSKILHKATSIKENEKRILISNTYCDICQENLLGFVFRNIKEFILNY